MNTTPTSIPEETRSWLLDPSDPGPRYLASLRLSSIKPSTLEKEAEKAHQKGPIKTILNKLDPDGFWAKDGPGYLPKYKSTVWSLILLAQLGASVKYDQKITAACRRYLDIALSDNGQISTNGPASGTIDCLQGNMLSALQDLGYEDDRIDLAYKWMAQSLTGQGVAPMSEKKAPLRYYSGKIGPGFQCGANNKLPCAWGGTKVMLAFGKLPLNKRTPLIKRAIQRGVEFLLASDPVEVPYPNGWNPKPSGNWWKFGFPVFYVTDLLQVCEALVRLGLSSDPRLANLLQAVLDKQNDQGRWKLEYDYSGKTWLNFGQKNEVNKWVTIRALEVLGFGSDKPLLEYR